MKMPATLLCDFYKLSHRAQYPEKTEIIYSTWTPRSNKHMPNMDKVVAFGFQAFIKKYLIKYFNENFFDRDINVVVQEYRRYLLYALNIRLHEADTSHIEALHNLGYLPIKIMALPEGTKIPMRVPMLTIQNTHRDFFWLTNYLETLMSCELWQPSTSATIADEYKRILVEYANETVGSTNFVPFQGHDFSMRGMAGLEAAAASGAGHLLSFAGTDTIPAIGYMEEYYEADITEDVIVGTSVPATEHSVMCAGGKEDEYETYRRLIEDVYPSGIVSIVSDTWDLWNTITVILPKLKDKIMSRDGKVVIRPDSGDPVDILCGVLTNPGMGFAVEDVYSEPEQKGVVELLWDIFGGTVNDKGYKELDPHIGAIYGDSITPERCKAICERLKAKGFASTNVVYGIGSYTYQYNTRDSFGFAMKSTLAQIDGVEKNIFKDPITDDGTKKSLTGAVCVFKDAATGELTVQDKFTLKDANQMNELRPIFINGEFMNAVTMEEVRARLDKSN